MTVMDPIGQHIINCMNDKELSYHGLPLGYAQLLSIKNFTGFHYRRPNRTQQATY